jgi:Domain of unknown function (DUF4070)
MRIGLIAMSGVRVRTKELAELGVTLPGFVNRGRVIASLPSLGLLTVAALTPSGFEVVYREIQDVSPGDPLEPFDLVAISSFTAQIDDLRAIEKIQSHGVTVNGCFILGLDNQTPEVFPQVRDFIRESGLIEAQITVLTPFPGTPLYRRLAREGRLIQPRFWDRCTLFDVNFHPRNMTIAELESGLRWLFREVYNDGEVGRRQRHYMELVKGCPEVGASPGFRQ